MPGGKPLPTAPTRLGKTNCVPLPQEEMSVPMNRNTAEPAPLPNRIPRQISLFSGCGGLDLGLAQAGFARVWANDFDADAQAVYSLNLGEIDPRNILTVRKEEIPDGDILTAGFPCQPFSNAGQRRGIHDSRGMLYKECLRIIQLKCPRWCSLRM